MRALVACVVWLLLAGSASAQFGAAPASINTPGFISPTPATVIAAAKAGIAARQVAALQYMVAHPSPPLTCSGAPQLSACDWGRISQALMLFALDARAGNTADVATANGYLTTALANLPHDALWKGLATPDTMSGTPLTIPNDFFHYSLAQELSTILRGFGTAGSISAGMLSSANETALRAVFANFASTSCVLAYADTSPTEFVFWGSENHGLMLDQTCAEAARIVVETPALSGTTFYDGSTAAQQLAAWTARQVYWLKQMGRSGTMLEEKSSTYAKYSLSVIYYLRDFSPDATTRTLAGRFLDLWWAEWAQESIDGNYGGADNRSYPSVVITKDPLLGVGPYVYFAQMTALPAGINTPLHIAMLVSGYVPPDVDFDIALDTVGRGSYAVRTRSMQATNAGAQMDANNFYHHCLGAGCVTSVRDTWVTPEFVMGSNRTPLTTYLTTFDQAGSQNIWQGVVGNGAYATGNANGVNLNRIVAQPVGTGTGNKSCYNCVLSVQSGPMMLVQGQPNSTYSHAYSYMAVDIGIGCKPYVEDDPIGRTGGVAVDCGTFYAYILDPLAVTNPYSWIADLVNQAHVMQVGGTNLVGDPVIIYAAGHSAYPTLSAFTAAVKEVPPVVDTTAGTVTADGPGGGAGRLAYNYLTPTTPPAIDGGNVSFSPGYCLRSPFVNSTCGTGIVTITKGSGRSSLSFN